VKAITFQGIHQVAFGEAPDPEIITERDAIVRVELAGLCGSDLHAYVGREAGLDPGTVMGHECVGRVERTGAEVPGFAPGQRVAVPFSTSCGTCYYCTRGLTARCSAGRLFGWVERGVGLQGAQAPLVRVPLADATLFPLPDDLDLPESLLLCDVLPTGYYCARMADVHAGGTFVVIGLGPVGLMAVLAARERGAERLYAVDTIEARLTRAEALGARPIDAATEDAPAVIRRATDGRGADGVMEAVGNREAARLAFDLVRAGGIVSTVGVHHDAAFPFSPAEAYDRNLTWRIGRCPARGLMEELLPLVRARRRELAALITHRLPLERGPEAYAMFDRRRDGCLKVAFEP